MQRKHAALIAMAIGVALAAPQNARADWLSAITRQTAKQAGKRAADQATKDAQPDTDQRTQSTFGGYNCTVNCSGHDAGYEWAKRNGIYDQRGCANDSKSFTEGCMAYLASPLGKKVVQTALRIRKATLRIVRIYKKNGLSGVKIEIDDCYQSSRGVEVRNCVDMDTAGRYIDRTTSLAFAFPQDDFFSDDAYFGRVITFTSDMGMDRNKSHEYLMATQEAVKKFIDQAF